MTRSDPQKEIVISADLPVDPSEEGGAFTSDSEIIGERFGKYLIVGELAMGGMAEIFLAVQRGLEGVVKVVVIKRVLDQYSANPEFVRLFIEEARLAARLEHPNIVRTYEFGEVGGQYFTAMEYLPGEDLVKVLNKLVAAQKQMPHHIAAGIISQVCAGLHFAHQLTDTAGNPLNLVHRDVNPANIIVTYGGEVKIIDFGVAKTDANKTINNTIKGKIAYMSPEQLVARGVDARSDVFSTGIVLWEMLTRKPLFVRDTEAATVYALMNDPIPPPSRHRPDIPPELEAIVMRALSRTPADRFETAEEMGSALEAFLAGQPKFDSRVLARTMKEWFGATRAEAKRAISQARSLNRNISLVMKLRTDVKAELMEGLSGLLAGSSGAVPRVETEGRGAFRHPVFLPLLLLVGLAGALLYVFGSGALSDSEGTGEVQAQKMASLQLSSTPSGAVISIDGEPTGLKTPATLTGLAASRVTVKLELPGYAAVTESIDLKPGETTSKQIALSAGPGRLFISELPEGAVVMVDGTEFVAGEAIEIPPGKHDVRVVVDGETVADQQIETASGFQRWKFDGDGLVPVP